MPTLRVDVSNDEEVAGGARVRFSLADDPARPMRMPVVLAPMSRVTYAEPQSGWSLRSFISNPFYLMMGVMALMMFAMPKMMENMDPEELKAMQVRSYSTRCASLAHEQCVSGANGFWRVVGTLERGAERGSTASAQKRGQAPGTGGCRRCEGQEGGLRDVTDARAAFLPIANASLGCVFVPAWCVRAMRPRHSRFAPPQDCYCSRHWLCAACARERPRVYRARLRGALCCRASAACASPPSAYRGSLLVLQNCRVTRCSSLLARRLHGLN